MNLATARAAQRITEVGIRKVVGANRPQLVKQFLGESFLLTLVAFGLSLALIQLILPAFNAFMGISLSFSLLSGGRFLAWMAGTVLVTGGLAGSYPALLLSSFQPAAFLKRLGSGGSGSRKLRTALVVFQFAVSVILIISALTVRNQLRFIGRMDVGFDRDQIVVVNLHDNNLQNFDALKTELESRPGILDVSVSDALPNNIQSQSMPDWPGRSDDAPSFDIYVAAVDEGYVDVFDLDIVSGRNFSRDFPADARGAFIFNQALVNALGWDSVVGREFTYWRSEVGRIVGVVKDFNFHSLHKNIEPMYLYHHENPWNRAYVSVKIQGGKIPESIDHLRDAFKKFSPGYPLDFNFFDDIFDQAYRSEQRLGAMFNIFAFLAIVIACLGLFGLAAFSMERRTKEIGIRKILGASIPGIFMLLSKDFLKWVLVSNILAGPVGFLAMHVWLQRFAYRVPMTLGLFLLAAAAAVTIALIPISVHTIRASLSSPVRSLRYE
jgi:putative ABC transport system permease protein